MRIVTVENTWRIAFSAGGRTGGPSSLPPPSAAHHRHGWSRRSLLRMADNVIGPATGTRTARRREAISRNTCSSLETAKSQKKIKPGFPIKHFFLSPVFFVNWNTKPICHETTVRNLVCRRLYRLLELKKYTLLAYLRRSTGISTKTNSTPSFPTSFSTIITWSLSAKISGFLQDHFPKETDWYQLEKLQLLYER